MERLITRAGTLATTLLLIIACGHAAPLNAAVRLSDSERLAYYEKIMDAYFRDDPRGKIRNELNKRVDTFNAQIEKTNRKQLAARAQLEKQQSELDALKAIIAALDKELTVTPSRDDAQAVADYNATVEKRNALAQEKNRRITAYNAAVEAFNAEVAAIKADTARKKAQLDADREKLNKQLDRLNAFFDSKKDVAFFTDLNRLLSRLTRASRTNPTPDTLAHIRHARALRDELGRIASDVENREDNGLIIVPATLDGKLSSHFILDTGATMVTIPMELVRTLGLEDRLGNEIETTLAGGETVKGRKLVIPALTVYGVRAVNVSAIVLPPSTAGVDGLLGRSFLSRFVVRIDDTKTPKVRFQPHAAAEDY